MAIDFPASPSLNDTFSSGGVTYTWDGTVWVASGSAAFVQKSGDTITGNLTLNADLTVDTDTLYVDSANNNVGIGVSSPGEKLEVKGTIVASADAGTDVSIRVNEGTTGAAFIMKQTATENTIQSSAAIPMRIGTTGTSSLALKVNDTDRLLIADGGDVGIGTSSPTERLHITDNNARIVLESTANSNSGEISFLGNDSSGNSFETFKLNTAFTGSVTISTDPTNSAFSTDNDIKFEQSGTESMRIDSSGNVGIGVSAPAQKLVLEGSDIVSTSASGAGRGTIHLQNTTGTPAQDAIGNALSFSRIGSDRRKAMIGSVQTGTDDNQTGLAFYTYGGTTTSTDFVVERLRIDAEGDVGIGTDSPGRTLHVLNSTSIVARFESTGTSFGGIELKDANTTADFQVQLAAVGDGLKIDTSGNERMRISSDGNVGIGTDTPSNKLHIERSSSGMIRCLNPQSFGQSDISLIGSRNSGGECGTVKFFNHRATATPNDDAEIFASVAGVSASSDVTGTNKGGALVFSTRDTGNGDVLTERARILASGGIAFNGDNTAANALDDYEEGTFTPTITDATAYTTQLGYYTKVGRLVTFTIRVQPSAGTGSGSTLDIGGLPFTTANIGNGPYGGAFSSFGTLVDRSSIPNLNWYMPVNNTVIRAVSGTAGITTNNSAVTLVGNYIFDGFYYTD